jgi:putative endonuclease
VVTRNFSKKFGELDLVMLDGQTLVFVEVRYRRSAAFGGALASVNRPKQRKIIAAAQAFRQSHPRLRHCACRFDVVSVSRSNYRPLFHWVSDAFNTDG